MGKYLFLLLLVAASGFSATGSPRRERINLDWAWKFSFGHATSSPADYNYGTARMFAKTAENYGTCIVPDFDDSAWENVDLPHDWAVSLPFEYTPNGDVKAHGYKPVGGGLYPQNSVGWYRKRFCVEEPYEGRKIVLTFDGVFRDSEVWVNNVYCGRHFSGYTGSSYDITDFVHYGSGEENVIVVRVDASKFEGWFYEGAGIYRHVWLDVFDRLHFSRDGIFIHADLDDSLTQAGITIRTEVENLYDRKCNAMVSTRIFDPDGRCVAEMQETGLDLQPEAKGVAESRIWLDNPELWDLDTPRRYRAVSIVRSGTDTVDRMETRFGIRDIRIDADKGLFLNGRNIKLQGVCCHQDHAGVGSALPDYLHYYRIGLLKEMGVNAYRTSHNPPAPELLEACDSLGMLVLDEVRALNSSSEYLSQLEALVLRDRNHPCVFMWSIGNEEETCQTKPEGRRIALSMMRRIRALDPSRTVTYGANIGNVQTGVSEVIPVRGFNYNLYGLDDYRKARPDQPILGSEVGSTVCTRGIYKVDSTRCYLTDFDENYPPWASTAEQWWTMAAAREWFMGGFVWTGFDYRGEPTPFGWPNVNSHFGVMDMCGFPKNIYYYYQAWWTDRDVLHVAPHWNWPGKEGEPIRVWVNSNADEVELYCNGSSLGKKRMPVNGHLEWEVAYRPGTLKAVAYKDGRRIVRTVRTTGEPCRIVLAPSKTTLHANGGDAVVVNVAVTDRKGQCVPDADLPIEFSIRGDASIIGVGNGDPSCHEREKCPDGAWSRSLFNGRCQVILKAGTSVSDIELTARSEGTEPATIIIKQR